MEQILPKELGLERTCDGCGGSCGSVVRQGFWCSCKVCGGSGKLLTEFGKSVIRLISERLDVGASFSSRP